jgi:exosortase D (VPLPA-CTERM-specific)
LVSYFGIGQAEGFLHYFEGWFIFMACICILFCEALILRRFLTRQTSNKPMLDFDTEGILGPLAKVRAITATPALIAATLVLLVAGAGWQAIPKGHAATQIARSSFNTFPLKIGEWQGRSSRLDPLIERSLNADDYVLADYSKPDGSQNVYLFVAYYSSQRGSSYIHSPQVCIPGGGWEVSNWSQVSISPGKSGGQPFAVNRAIVDKGELRQLVYYWFDQRGRRLTNDYHSKIDTMWSGVVSGRTDGALVRLIVPLEKGQDPSQGDEVLRTFLDGTLPLLPKYLPGA